MEAPGQTAEMQADLSLVRRYCKISFYAKLSFILSLFFVVILLI